MKIKHLSLLLVPLVLVAGALALAWGLQQPTPLVIQGEVEATEVAVAAKIPGRVAAIAVAEGQTIARGDLVATLESPELEAKLAQARAAAAAAEAQQEKARRGTRSEQIQAAYNQWQRARAGEELAVKSFERVDNLFKDGVLPAQKRDEAEANLKSAREMASAAKATYDMALAGARSEDKAAAAALTAQAQGAVSEVEAYLEETRLRAPIGGEVALKVVAAGEMVSAGFPVVKIVDLADIWVVFHLREDLLAGLGMGTRIRARFPALSDQAVDLTVDYIAPLGDFATWRATRASGDFDLKTFELHARPGAPVPGLRPGMSAIVRMPATDL